MTDQAVAVRDLWAQFLIAAAVVGGAVWLLITVSIVRYGRRSAVAGPDGAAPQPPQLHGSTRLEIAWTLIPIAIVAVLFWLTLGALGRIDARGAGGVTVEVTAYRWQWRFVYPELGVTVEGGPDTPAEMVVPVGEPIHIVLTSADVAHSFYVPQFLFKRDAIPGQVNAFDVTIREAATYRGQCAEFCGVFHDRMLLSVRAVSRAEFDAWVASQPKGSAAASSAPSSSAASSAAP
ncbi:MAG TPA: cytochrome c oxidase subunit II [Candidatus Limnocylindrales bacterium]|nr:cytochrome c oxidase subunit II [Candidatus Limnocylindrales bacterium]